MFVSLNGIFSMSLPSAFIVPFSIHLVTFPIPALYAAKATCVYFNCDVRSAKYFTPNAMFFSGLLHILRADQYHFPVHISQHTHYNLFYILILKYFLNLVLLLKLLLQL